MSIILGGVTLNPDMVWREQYASLSVSQSMRRTIYGSPVIYSNTVYKGKPITLSATESVNGVLIGMLKKSVVDSLLSMAALNAATYSLSIRGSTFNVMFDHRTGSAVDMLPIIARASLGANDLMRGDIKLFTV